MLTDRFFMFRNLLLGESARLNPFIFPKGLAGEFADSGVVVVAIDDVLKDLKDVMGSNDVADSGDELGDGSVRAESMVETVVVGDDSTDSKVDAESLRNSGDEMLEFCECCLKLQPVEGPGGPFNTSPVPALSCVPMLFPTADIDEARDVSSRCGSVSAGIADARSPLEDPPRDVLRRLFWPCIMRFESPARSARTWRGVD